MLIQLFPHCGNCGQELVLNSFLLDFLILSNFVPEEFLNNEDNELVFKNCFFPLFVNKQTKKLTVVGWCNNCQRPAFSSISVYDLVKLAEEGGKTENGSNFNIN